MAVNMTIQPDIINKAYRRHLFNNKRFQIFYGGSSSGKSAFLSQRAVIDVMKGRNYLVVRNVHRTHRQSTFNEIKKYISAFNLKNFFDINRSELVVTCTLNNKQILFCGLDDVEKLKSITPVSGVLDTIWIEEATETGYTDFKQLIKRLRGKSRFSKRIVLSFNPILKDHWIYREFFKEWQDDKTEYEDSEKLIIKTTYKDNSFLEPDDIKALESEDDKYYYDVYTLGNWGVLGAVIFKNWEVQDLSSVRESFDNFRNGLDFGFAKDPAAFIHTHYDRKKKTIYILNEIYQTELTNDILADLVKDVIGGQPVFCDSAEPKSIKELKINKVNAFPVAKGCDSITHGIQWLQQQKIIIDVKCQNAKNEFQKYKWKENKDGIVIPVPVGKEDHLVDALRYAYENEFSKAYNSNTGAKAFLGGSKLKYEEW